MHNDTAIHHDARAEAIEPAISRRVIRIGRPPQRWFHHALLLLGGVATVSTNTDDEPLSGPALALFPPSEGESLTIAAGAHGYLIGVSPEIIGEAIGDHAESLSLRLYSGSHSLADHLEAESIRELSPLFTGLIAELHQEGRAARMVVAAYTRLILMAAWRLQGADERSTARPSSTGAILQRFRQSVEMNYRQRRTISEYADELGISTDRLHAICQRTLARSPLELVHDRLLQEAKLRLERAAHDVQDISDSLGFRDPANFSQFFKRKTGVSPTKYRSLAASASATIPLSSGYADWP
ncbi:helix-turn-helix domain-containing protein [Rhizobium sp. KVB221]|uniref:Helix-turn-helix domain-containing protein n=1 Tax=Rhizobium setariae TaxID=2801340 RepID=A0A937CLH4_9HYPH|nr:helix-turn-helix transcriptional regulator [Rhizobium setariae]MBL0371646.1 helix-turn-helix domain-containing protein [Rhizobium setariae]